MSAFGNAVLALIDDLRAAEVRISVAESIDAMRAVGAAGLECVRMREALAAALIKDEADRVRFDEVFARHFAAARSIGDRPRPSRGGRIGVAGSAGGPSDGGAADEPRPPARDDQEPPRGAGRTPRPSVEQEDEAAEASARPGAPAEGRANADREGDAAAAARGLSADATAAAAGDPGAAEDRQAGDAEVAGTGDRAESDAPGPEAGRAAALRAIERMPFAAYSDAEYGTAHDALAVIRRRFRLRVSRRLRIASAGRIDFRRTIRAALQHGGALGDLRFRARRPRHVDLLILADLSGSMKYASTLMLEIVAGARECFRRVRSLVYIDRIAEAGFERGHLVMTPPLDLYARSDFGRVLGEVRDHRATLLSRTTVIVIMGDGRNNRRPARADLLRDLARTCRAVFWLNPEPPARWNTGDSAIRQYAREVTAMIECANLRDLERGLARVV